MVRDLLAGLDTGVLAQIGLVAFVVAFVAVLVYTFTLAKGARLRAKGMPLSEPEELPQPIQ